MPGGGTPGPRHARTGHARTAERPVQAFPDEPCPAAEHPAPEEAGPPARAMPGRSHARRRNTRPRHARTRTPPEASPAPEACPDAPCPEHPAPAAFPAPACPGRAMPGASPAPAASPGRAMPGAPGPGGIPGPGGRGPGGGTPREDAAAAGAGAAAARRRHLRGGGGGHGVGLLPHQRLHLVEQHLALEGLGDVVVGPGGAGAGLVEGLEGAGQQQHGDALRGGIALERLADLVAVLARHHHVREHHIRTQLARPGDGVQPVVDRGDLEVLGREDHPDHLADGERVVGDQQILGHRFGPRGIPTPQNSVRNRDGKSHCQAGQLTVRHPGLQENKRKLKKTCAAGPGRAREPAIPGRGTPLAPRWARSADGRPAPARRTAPGSVPPASARTMRGSARAGAPSSAGAE